MKRQTTTVGYTTRDVSSLLGLSERQVREYARSGVLEPGRGPGNQFRFGFQDLVLLRAARALLDARVPQRRILRALRRLKEQLPRDRSLTELRIAAAGDEVVAFDQGQAWEPESGQLHLMFDVADLAARVADLDAHARADAAGRGTAGDVDAWLERGLDLEAEAPERARDAYEKVLEIEPDHADALANLGRLHYEQGATEAAIVHYRRALAAADGDHPVAAFNLGLALEDVGRLRAATDAYRAALLADPGFADAHYHLSRVYEKRGDRLAALRHLKAYRALVS